MTSTLPYLTSPKTTQQSNSDHKKLRSACDSCHQCKVKCSGGSPCFRCTSKGLNCRYGYQNRAGKPKGSKNRKTLEREHQLRMEWLTSQLRDANGELGNLNIDLSDSTTLLPSPYFPSSRWKQGHIPLQSSVQPTPANQCIKSTEHENDCLPTPHELDTWTMDLGPILQTPREGTSESLEAFTTPISFTGETYLRQLSDPTTPISFGFPSPHARLDVTGDPCACVQTQAVNISTLHQLTCRDRSDRFDLAMKSITSTLETCEKFIACDACDKSMSSILLTLSAIELIFTLFEQLTMNNRRLSPPDEEQRLIPCSLGDYKVTREEGQAIRNVLVKMTLSKGRQALDALQNLVNGSVDFLDESAQCDAATHNSSANEPMLRGLSVTDRDYMTQCISRKNAALEVLMAAVAA
ncbi:hypothetical protein ALT_1518 [Aspergillus lentulus]|uniref:Zn(2)-C6 fungal-type domain-containing protein n=1 Tax=Aspergillus lentulus TaxID=293939 RepID=A0AAN4PCZ2_ASPLE|nr:hypothetical protein ALT_1518 [Aspergillus lentulus]